MAAALYIHIPFCAGKCAYCDFVSYAGRRRDMARYLSAVKRELGARAGELAGKCVDTVYIGGGTPTFMGAQALGEIMDAVRASYALGPECEVSCEANPGTVTRAELERLRAAGINRLSLGVQAAQDGLLRAIGRIHTAYQAREAFYDARAAGFDNINLDFMYALPGQTPAMWRDTLAFALDLAPEHLSLYSLILEEGTRMYDAVQAGRLRLPDEDDELMMMDEALRSLQAAGYRRYEISNYCRPGRECRHNLLYWRNGQYLGVGCAAHSRLGDERLYNADDLEEYMEHVEQCGSGRSGSLKLAPDDDAFDTLMLGTRMTAGVDLSEFAARHGDALLRRLLPELERLKHQGLAALDGGRFALTARGLLLQNSVLVDIMEALDGGQ